MATRDFVCKVESHRLYMCISRHLLPTNSSAQKAVRREKLAGSKTVVRIETTGSLGHCCHWATVAKVSHKKSAAVACSQQQQRAELLSDDASDCFPEDSCRYQHCSWAFHQIDHLLQQPCSEQLIFQKVSFFRFSLTRRRFNPRAKGG